MCKVVEILQRHEAKTEEQAGINTANQRSNPQLVFWKKIGINICFTFTLAADI
jgi:hypothetical protein